MADGTDVDTLFIKYDKTGTNNTVQVYSRRNSNIKCCWKSTLVVATHTGSAGIQAGVYYINGFHVKVDSSTLVLDKYTNTHHRIGLTIVSESFVTPEMMTHL